MEQVEVQSIIKAPLNQVWDYWTLPQHIVNWNFASPDWHCPKAENNLHVGGEFHYVMEAKDGSFNFDFWGTYVTVEERKHLEIRIGEGEECRLHLNP